MFDSELLIEKSRHRILHRILDLPARTFIHDEEGVRSQAGMTARHVGTELSVIGELQSANSRYGTEGWWFEPTEMHFEPQRLRSSGSFHFARCVPH